MRVQFYIFLAGLLVAFSLVVSISPLNIQTDFDMRIATATSTIVPSRTPTSVLPFLAPPPTATEVPGVDM